MNPAELMARLEAGVSKADFIPGGTPEIEREDISFALAKVGDPLAQDLVRAKYCLIDTDLTRLLGRVYYLVNAMAHEQQWRINKSGLLVDVCKVVLQDYLKPHVCEVCSGRKHAIVNHRLVTCSQCNGVGIKHPTDKDRAKRIGMDAKFYRLVWASRFAKIAMELVSREITAMRIMAQALE